MDVYNYDNYDNYATGNSFSDQSWNENNNILTNLQDMEDKMDYNDVN